jgi:hypothetical protein
VPKSELAIDLAAEPPQRVIDAIADDAERYGANQAVQGPEQWYPGVGWTDWLMLQWIAALPDASPQSRNLIRAIQKRRLYKRIATLARGDSHRDIIARFEEKRWPEKVDICKKLHEEVHLRLNRNWGNLQTVTPLNKSDLDVLATQHLLILIDLPRPDQKVGYDRPLGVVPELKERLYQQDNRQAYEDTAWRKTMVDMIEGSAPLRILCHPDIRTLVSAAYAPTAENPATVESNFANLLRRIMEP